MSFGGSARYRNGGVSVSRSCVPIATSVRRRQMLWCILSCRSRNELYERSSKVQSRSTAHTTNGRICAVAASTLIVSGEPPGKSRRLYVGAGAFPLKTFSARASPSRQRMSYRLAGTSTLYTTSVCAGSLPARVFVVFTSSSSTSSSSIPNSKHSSSNSSCVYCFPSSAKSASRPTPTIGILAATSCAAAVTSCAAAATRSSPRCHEAQAARRT